MMRQLAVFLIFLPSVASAASGFADSHYEHQRWIFPAYAYCLAFGLLALICLYITSRIFISKTRQISECISEYLMQHKVLAIVVAGVLLAIPIGIIGAVAWEIFWFVSIIPVMGLMVVFPIILVIKRFREKILISPMRIKWGIMICISAIAATLLFILTANGNLLPGTDVTYLAKPHRWRAVAYFPTHPYDSIREIWTMPIVFIGEIIISLLLYLIGKLIRFLYGKLSALRH